MYLSPAHAASVVIRVGLAFDVSACQLTSPDGLEVADAQGRPLRQLGDAALITPAAGGFIIDGRTQMGEAVIIRARNGAIALGGRSYRGQMVVLHAASGRLNVVNYVDIESYIQGVLAGEVPFSWPEESLKAQAVAARSYVLHQMQVYGGRDWDVVATDKDQVYEGMAGEVPSIVRAVQATKGEVLTHDAKIVKAYFSSACGGHTEDAVNAFTDEGEFLRGVPDPYCEQSPYQTWTREFTMQQLRRALGQRASALGKVIDIKLARRGSSGRALDIIVVREGGEEKMAGAELRRLLGYRDLRSTLFDIRVLKSVPVTFAYTRTEYVNLPVSDVADTYDLGQEEVETVSATLKPEVTFHVISGSGALDKARAGYAYAATSSGILRTFAMRPGLEAVALVQRLAPEKPVATVPQTRRERIVTTTTSQRQVPVLLSFRGRGWGHGVGMCQWGARGMAARGLSYREILAHYYPSTKLMVVEN